jgi:hypothetical protein
MAQPNGTTTTLTGTVEAANERGVKVNGGWLNVSKYHPVALPMRGALITLDVQGGRWIQRCDVLDGQPESTQVDLAPSGARSPHANTRERTITRLAVLKAAAAFAASRPEAKSCDVPTVAEAWLRWVLAEEGGDGAPAA